MAKDDKNWFIRERSEALASLLLTSRDDLVVSRENMKDDGVDIYVAIKEGEGPPTRLFVVQVKGTMSSNESDWMNQVKQLYKAERFYLPACVFVVNVRDNSLVYAWVAEPTIESNSAKLSFFERPEFQPLDKDKVDGIINRVRTWYDAIPLSLPANN